MKLYRLTLKKYFIISIIFILFFTACSKDNEYNKNNNKGKQKDTITASLSTSDKAFIEDTTIRKEVGRNEIKYGIGEVEFCMKYVEGGKFKMGADNGDDTNIVISSAPEHNVKLKSYYIGEIEITQELWHKVMKGNKNKIFIDPGYFTGDKLPITNVSWYEVVVFCNRLSKKFSKEPVYSLYGNTDVDTWGAVPITNSDTWNNIKMNFFANGFRLPTEAEWEYAAKGGQYTSNFIYSGGNNLDDVSWNQDNSGKRTHVVGQKNYNELWLYDMSGNVWEWCWDWSAEYKRTWIFSQNNPTGPSVGEKRIIRGGGFDSYLDNIKVTYRYADNANKKHIDAGARIASSN
ncbi:MAG: SUMF1/EgtB/PvdO family nonheme iron enzyme [Bacteroidetes bacterium]|nr:SUMF1/EgtB/PvdO family nonheme iron enzyme [Bacteroidota bacterium]